MHHTTPLQRVSPLHDRSAIVSIGVNPEKFLLNGINLVCLRSVADVHPGPPVPWPGVRPKKLLKKSKKLLKKNKYTTSR